MTNVDVVRHKLKDQVPLLQHIAVDIVEYEPGEVVVEAPLEPNLNTHGTAFGGSLYCVATMCGWSLVHLTLMDAGFEPSVWVTQGEVSYLKPVTGCLRAQAKITDDVRLAIIEEYEQRGKVRFNVAVEMYSQDQLALTLDVTFMATR